MQLDDTNSKILLEQQSIFNQRQEEQIKKAKLHARSDELKPSYNQELLILKQQLLERQRIVQQLKQSIASKQYQLSNRCQQREQFSNNKSRLSKYFSLSEQANTNNQKYLKQKIKQSRNEIEAIRKQLNKLLKKKVSDAGTIKLNQQLQRLSNKKAELKRIREQKDILDKERQEMEKQIKDKDLQQIIIRNTSQKTQYEKITSSIRQQKAMLQSLQKQDRYLTQKFQFYLNSISKRQVISRANTEAKRQISVEMKGISRQMKLLLQQKDGVDIETKRTIDQLKLNIKTTETDNWMIVNKLRQYDAYLLKHYNQQRKKNSALVYNSVQQIPELNVKEVRLTEPTRKAQSIVKKKELIEICRGEDLIKLSDYQLKPDRILGIQIYYSNSILIGICGRYLTSFGIEFGYKISSFPLPKQTQKTVFLFKQGDQIEEFGIGYSKIDQIVHLEFKTKSKQMLSWGDSTEVNVQRKNIQSASKIWIVGSLGFPTSISSLMQKEQILIILLLKGQGFRSLLLVKVFDN